MKLHRSWMLFGSVQFIMVEDFHQINAESILVYSELKINKFFLLDLALVHVHR
jgi:hypothetical protein